MYNNIDNFCRLFAILSFEWVSDYYTFAILACIENVSHDFVCWLPLMHIRAKYYFFAFQAHSNEMWMGDQNSWIGIRFHEQMEIVAGQAEPNWQKQVLNGQNKNLNIPVKYRKTGEKPLKL